MVRTATLDSTGRILIPKDLRTRLGLHSGDAIAMEERDGELVLFSRRKALADARAYLRQFADGSRWSEELIEERRNEAKAELDG